MLISILVLFLWSSFVCAMEEQTFLSSQIDEMDDSNGVLSFAVEKFKSFQELDGIVANAGLTDFFRPHDSLNVTWSLEGNRLRRIFDRITFNTVDKKSITVPKKICLRSKFLEALINFPREQDDIQLKKLDYATLHNLISICYITNQKKCVQKRILERLSLEESAQIWGDSDYFIIEKAPFIPQYTRYLMSKDGEKDIKKGELKLLGDNLENSIECCQEELRKYPPSFPQFMAGILKKSSLTSKAQFSKTVPWTVLHPAGELSSSIFTVFEYNIGIYNELNNQLQLKRLSHKIKKVITVLDDNQVVLLFEDGIGIYDLKNNVLKSFISDGKEIFFNSSKTKAKIMYDEPRLRLPPIINFSPEQEENYNFFKIEIGGNYINIYRHRRIEYETYACHRASSKVKKAILVEEKSGNIKKNKIVYSQEGAESSQSAVLKIVAVRGDDTINCNHAKPIDDFLINKAESIVVTFNKEHSHIKVWDLETGTLLNTLKQRNHTLLDLCISPDDTKIVTLSNNNGQSHVTLFDMQTGEKINTFSLPKMENGKVGISYLCDKITITSNGSLAIYTLFDRENIDEKYIELLEQGTGKTCFLHHLLEQRKKQNVLNVHLDQQMYELYKTCDEHEKKLTNFFWDTQEWSYDHDSFMAKVKHGLQMVKNNPTLVSFMNDATAVTKKTFTNNFTYVSLFPFISTVLLGLVMKSNYIERSGIAVHLGAFGGASLPIFVGMRFNDKKKIINNFYYWYPFLILLTGTDCSLKELSGFFAIDLGVTLFKNSWLAYDKYSFKKAPLLFKVMMKNPKITSYFSYATDVRRDLLVDNSGVNLVLGLSFMYKLIQPWYSLPFAKEVRW